MSLLPKQSTMVLLLLCVIEENASTPARSRRVKKPKAFADYYVPKRKKRESDAAFFKSVGYDPKIGGRSERNVLESLDHNSATTTPVRRRKVKKTKSFVERDDSEGIGSIARAAFVDVTPPSDDNQGVSNSALDIEPVILAGTTEGEFRRTKYSFLHESNIYDKWVQPNGKAFHKRLEKAIQDEKQTDGTNGTTSKRKIDTANLAPAMWDMTTFCYTTRHKKTRAKAMVQSLFRELAVDSPDDFRNILVKESSLYLRKEVFQAWKFQRSIDMYANGGLNYEACNTIRSGVEGLQKNEQGVIPSGSTVALRGKELEQYGAEKFGLSLIDSTTDHGPSLSLEFDTVIRLLVKGYGLEKYAVTGSNEKPVLLAFTLDGAQLTNQLGHVTAGVKIVDPRAIDPLTGLPICLYQSRDLCFPLQITFGKDCKALYKDCFSNFFAYFKSGISIPGHIGGDSPLSNFECASPQDLASTWKATGLGSGAFERGARLPCHICMCGRDELCCYKTGSDRCALCIDFNAKECYCHPVCDASFLEKKKESLTAYVADALDDGYKKLDKIAKNTRLHTDPTQSDRLTNPLHIQYEPSASKEKREYMSFLKDELRLRLKTEPARLNAVLAQPSLEVRRRSLLDLIKKEKQIELARLTVSRHDAVRDLADKLAIEDCIPCLLHLEMRVNEKVFWSLLQYGCDRYLEGDGETKNRYFEAVEGCIQTQLLGDLGSKRVSQWQLPVKEGKIEPKTMTNVTSRKCIMGLKSLVDVIFSHDLDEKALNPQQCRHENEQLRIQWHDLSDAYINMITLLRKRTDFTDVEINQAHILTNTFMSKWVHVMKGQSITNYIHILGAGHLHYYLRKYRNLYKFSQQGWEALNQKLKHFYFNNTNHGGCEGNKNGSMVTNDHVRPLMRMCQRYLLWRLGHGDQYFLSKLNRLVAVNDAISTEEDKDEDLDDEDEQAFII